MTSRNRGGRVPIFGIIVTVILINIFLDANLPLVPIIIGAVIFSMATGGSGRRSVGGGRGSGTTAPAPPAETGAQEETGFSRIDVPRYPGDAPPPPLPSQPSRPAAEPPPPASATSSPTGETAYPSSTSTDPVVSLGQLHLARLGRELDAAARTGTQTDVGRVLGEVQDVAQRSLTMLDGASGVPGSGRKEFESGLRRLEREVGAARGEQPPGSKVGRVVQTCTALGQTGRYA